MLTVRKAEQQDVESLKLVIETTSLFPSELLDGMMDDYFKNSSSEDIWLTAEVDNKQVAVAYCAPERLTEGTFNLYLIAVHKDFQGRGVGAEIMKHVENLLSAKGQRILIVETSGLPEFELTRKFYDKCDYHREAVIRDFYREGEDKVVFWKKLNG
jgi:ribosomal protein S18 acetylase RimI-like enzyme